MKASKYFIILLLFILCGHYHAYSNGQISVSSLSLTEQLPSNSVLRIFQDKKGFMWFGTLDGLCRYDGYRALIFRSNLNNPDLLPDNEITCITEDDADHLLIGTKKGMSILDQRTYQIGKFEGAELDNQEIRSITQTSDGNIWVGTYRQIFRYNPDFTLRKKYDSSIPIGSINSIYEDLNGNLWVAVWQGGLYRYDKDKDTFVALPQIGETNNPFKVFQDNQKQLWICTWGDGMYLFNPEKDEENMYTAFPVYNKDRLISEDCFFSITQDDINDYIWLMSASGIHTFRYTENNTLQQVDVSHLFAGSNNIFSEIIKDKAGNLWIGTFSEGALSINFNKTLIQNHPISSIKEITGITPNITTIYEDNDGDIWFNQNRWGLGFFNPKENKVRFYQDFPSTRNIPGLNLVNCISNFRSKPNEVWIGTQTEGIIYCMKKENGNIVLVDKIDLKSQVDNPGDPLIFFEDRRNNIWIGTTTGLVIIPYSKESIISYPLSSITGITEDTKGTIWISCASNGIYQIPVLGSLAIDELKIKNYSKTNGNFISNNIASICADINGIVWIGTKEGNILTYDVIKQEFADMSSTIKVIGEGILNIIADDFGHIWISSNKRIIEYNPVNGASKSYSNTDGVLVNSFLTNSFFKNNSGKIFFGGNKGISIFTSSEKLSEDPKTVKSHITDVKINNQSVFYGNNNIRFNIAAQKLTLEPDDKNIEIDFSTLDYTFPTKIQYAYKMDGIDDDWVYAENGRQFAIYNQLTKGNHTFRIIATDENGLWSNKTTVLKIYKRPAFYETWWAYTIYFIFAIICLYLSYRTVKNRIKLQNELKITQIEKEKSEELTQSKLRYFTNVSHDFLTPLTIISCLIDDVEMSYKGKITQFETMRSNVNRLKRLLQQVLDFRKMESGNMKLKISHGNFVSFIKDICNTHFVPLANKKNIQLSFSSEFIQIQAYFDSDKIDKIVFNLLSNAIKYTPEGGAIKVEVEKKEKHNRNFAIVKVSDTGIGIAQEELNNIFTRFYNNKKDKTYDSNGIGLSLIKDLLDLHHGTIHVESDVNHGTTFSFEIPIDRDCYNETEIKKGDNVIILDQDEPTNAEIAEFEKKELLEKDLENANPEKEETTVLLAEDNEELQMLIKNILEKEYKVFGAKNGNEALSIIKENDIDIVISDVMMPEMDGLELCETIKQNLETSHIPVILLTAKNSAEDRIACYNAGADAYISKPFELKVLEARINNFMLNKKDKQKEFKSDVEINISALEYQSFDEQFLNNAVKIIENQLSENDLDVNIFAKQLNMSKSSLYRKIKTMTGLSPNEFIRNIRLKHACQMLKSQSISISEVAYSVGFSDPKYFTLCFKNEFDMTPREYQNLHKNQEESTN